jgi:hypothetical protein
VSSSLRDACGKILSVALGRELEAVTYSSSFNSSTEKIVSIIAIACRCDASPPRAFGHSLSVVMPQLVSMISRSEVGFRVF